MDVMKPRTTALIHYLRDIEYAMVDNVDMVGVKPLWANTSTATSGAGGISGTLIYENTVCAQYGIQALNFNYSHKVSASTDLSTWVEIGTSSSLSIPAEYQKYRYWKIDTISGLSTSARMEVNMTSPDLVGNLENVHFDTPPAVGAVITADYITPMVAKDSNHVFDFTLELQFGEYTP